MWPELWHIKTCDMPITREGENLFIALVLLNYVEDSKQDFIGGFSLAIHLRKYGLDVTWLTPYSSVNWLK